MDQICYQVEHPEVGVHGEGLLLLPDLLVQLGGVGKLALESSDVGKLKDILSISLYLTLLDYALPNTISLKGGEFELQSEQCYFTLALRMHPEKLKSTLSEFNSVTVTVTVAVFEVKLQLIGLPQQKEVKGYNLPSNQGLCREEHWVRVGLTLYCYLIITVVKD